MFISYFSSFWMAFPRFSRKARSRLYDSRYWRFSLTRALFCCKTSYRRLRVSLLCPGGYLVQKFVESKFDSDRMLCYVVLTLGTQIGSLLRSPQIMSNFSLNISGRSKSKRSISFNRFRFPFFLFLVMFSAALSILNNGRFLCYLVSLNSLTSFSIASYCGLLYIIPSTLLHSCAWSTPLSCGAGFSLFRLIFRSEAILWCMR